MKSLILSVALICTAQIATAIEVTEPVIEKLNSVEFSSIDDYVKTLGEVAFILDSNAARDDLLELEARQKNFTLDDGTPLSVFGYNTDAGVLFGATAPITFISVTGREGDNVLALFYDQDNHVIAPPKDSFKVFDLALNPLTFNYIPALPPNNVTMDVSLLIDVSGSMASVLQGVTNASRDFMKGLPDFTRCSVITFGSTVDYLTERNVSKLKPCPETVSVLDNGLTLNGMTALHLAMKQSMEDSASHKTSLPNLQVIITDGADTMNPEIKPEDLKALKSKSNSKILLFWAGSYVGNYMSDVADIEAVAGANIKTDLEKFFLTLGISINGMQSITLK